MWRRCTVLDVTAVCHAASPILPKLFSCLRMRWTMPSYHRHWWERMSSSFPKAAYFDQVSISSKQAKTSPRATFCGHEKEGFWVFFLNPIKIKGSGFPTPLWGICPPNPPNPIGRFIICQIMSRRKCSGKGKIELLWNYTVCETSQPPVLHMLSVELWKLSSNIVQGIMRVPEKNWWKDARTKWMQLEEKKFTSCFLLAELIWQMLDKCLTLGFT